MNLTEPALELFVHGAGADDFFRRIKLPFGRIKKKWLRLVAAHPAMTADQLLERRHLITIHVEETVHQYIGAVGKTIFSQQVLGCPRTEISQRILAYNPPFF